MEKIINSRYKQISFSCRISCFQDELTMFDYFKLYTNKQLLLSTIKRFLSHAENNFDFDIYGVSLKNQDLDTAIKYSFRLDMTKTHEVTLCKELSKFRQTDFQIFMINVAVHIGRKLIKINKNNLDIFVFDFNNSKKDLWGTYDNDKTKA